MYNLNATVFKVPTMEAEMHFHLPGGYTMVMLSDLPRCDGYGLSNRKKFEFELSLGVTKPQINRDGHTRYHNNIYSMLFRPSDIFSGTFGSRPYEWNVKDHVSR